jgi:hypothetical protein
MSYCILKHNLHSVKIFLLVLIFNAVVIAVSSKALDTVKTSHSTLLQLILKEQSLRLQLETKFHQLQSQVLAHQFQIVSNTGMKFFVYILTFLYFLIADQKIQC